MSERRSRLFLSVRDTFRLPICSITEQRFGISPMWRGGSNAFSPMLGPKEGSVFVASSLLEPVADMKSLSPLRLFRVYLVVSSEVFDMKRAVTYTGSGIRFHILMKMEHLYRPSYLLVTAYQG